MHVHSAKRTQMLSQMKNGGGKSAQKLNPQTVSRNTKMKT